MEHYNLDMVLALGFGVRSLVGVRFHQWANDKLKEYLVKGFVLDYKRLKKSGKGRDYFDELPRCLQDIHINERCFYQKIIDISQPAWIMTQAIHLLRSSSSRCRTRCITPSMGKLLLS